MEIATLATTPLEKIIVSFLAAFENYYVPMPTDHRYYQERWKAAGVDLNRSYGMFDDGQLVAFIIHAVDKRAGKLTAFNTGTGVIPEYRGRRIVKTMYEYALNDLRENGFERSTLEVITKNTKAVRAYQSVGFRISRKYKCYAGDIKLENEAPFTLKETTLEEVDWDKLPNQQFYSWDFQQSPILAGRNVFYEVLKDNKAESYFILKPERQQLLQFDLLNGDGEGWKRLFSAIQQVTGSVRIINVDERLTGKIAILEEVGLAVSVEQFEMELEV